MKPAPAAGHQEKRIEADKGMADAMPRPGFCTSVGVSNPDGASVADCCATPASRVNGNPGSRTITDVTRMHLRMVQATSKSKLNSNQGNSKTQAKSASRLAEVQAVMAKFYSRWIKKRL